MGKPIITAEQITWVLAFQNFLEKEVLRHIVLDRNAQLRGWNIAKNSSGEHTIELLYGETDLSYDVEEVVLEDLMEENWRQAVNKRILAELVQQEKAKLLAEEAANQIKKEARRSLYEELKKEFEDGCEHK